MRLCEIILPTHDNDGKPLDDVHQELSDRIVAEFRCGFHEVCIRGAWPHPETGEILREVGIKYVIATDCAEADSRLRMLAQWSGKRADQFEVYVQYCDGTVENVKILRSGKRAA